MIHQLGYSAFITAIIISAINFILIPLLYKKNSKISLFFCEYVNLFLLILILFSTLSLIYSLLVSNFDVKLVLQNSSLNENVIYKIVSLWSNYEGSSLLWLLLFNCYNYVFIVFLKKYELPTVEKIAIIFILNCLFLAYILYVFVFADPFIKISNMHHCPDGIGINPLLRDPAMIFHPPFLYLGYVGFAIPFAIAMVALIFKNINTQYIYLMTFWASIIWIFLTIGIVSGSFWAYYEIGWGGWWFWDAVENVSLLPWISVTALLHFAIVYKKTGTLGMLCLGLAVLSYALTIFGTYVVRSGILTSVHSFSQNIERSNSILIFLIFLCAVFSFLYLRYYWSCGFYCRKKNNSSKQYLNEELTRENKNILPSNHHFSHLLIWGNGLMLLALSIILLGTVAPLFMNNHNITINNAFFDNTIIPIVGLIMLTMGVSINYKNNPGNLWKNLIKQNMYLFNIILLSLVILLYGKFNVSLLALIGFNAGLFVLIAIFKKISTKNLGINIAHLGFAISVIAMAIDSEFKQSKVILLKQDKYVKVHNYYLKLNHVTLSKTNGTESLSANIDLYKNKTQLLSVLKPQQINYNNSGMVLNKTAIFQQYFSHIYLILGPKIKNSGWTAQVIYHPLVFFIWFGGLMIAIGIFIMLFKWRRRLLK